MTNEIILKIDEMALKEFKANYPNTKIKDKTLIDRPETLKWEKIDLPEKSILLNPSENIKCEFIELLEDEEYDMLDEIKNEKKNSKTKKSNLENISPRRSARLRNKVINLLNVD